MSSIGVALVVFVAAVLLCETNGHPSGIQHGKYEPHLKKNVEAVTYKKKAKPTPGTAPLDPNETIAHELESLTQILGLVTGGVSGLVAGLTGVSLTNCATQIKGKGDLDTMTCAQFIDAVSNCESLMYVKDLLQEAKKRYKKDPNSKKPCFK